MPIIKECLICHNEYKTKPCLINKSKYCSIVCQHKALAIYYESIAPRLICKICKKIFIHRRNDNKRLFCSLKCQHENLKIKFSDNYFDSEVLKEKLDNSYIITENGCHLWKGAKSRRGYGIISYGNKINIQAHRASYIIHNGKIPTGLFICHHCDVPACINIDHLFIGTPNDNVQDMINKGRSAEGFKKGSIPHNRKLKFNDVVEIKHLIKQNISNNKIAQQFYIDPRTIQDIKNGRTWQNITIEK